MTWRRLSIDRALAQEVICRAAIFSNIALAFGGGKVDVIAERTFHRVHVALVAVARELYAARKAAGKVRYEALRGVQATVAAYSGGIWAGIPI